MKGKLVGHYFISFIVACTIIFLTNITFMVNNIYKQGDLYSFEPSDLIENFKEYIIVKDYKTVSITDDGIKKLSTESIGVQILDRNNKEIYSFNKPYSALINYSVKDIVNLYTNTDETMFLEEVTINGEEYTYLLFFNPDKVNRIVYTYDVLSLMEAHRFPILITINIILILIMSWFFTVRISKPINRIIDKIVELSNGEFSSKKINKGIYYKVEDRLNSLGDRLNHNEIERHQVEEMREEWICNITHDIKTPLTSIIGNAEILSDTDYDIDNELRVKNCSIIISKSQYIKTLVEDLNLSTRLINNTIYLKKRSINIVSLIRHVVIDVINDEKYNDNNIEFKYSNEEIYLEIDERLMKRVFVNLIINAFIHNDDEVKVSINILQSQNGEVSISIKDNGQGISKDELDSIFKRYYRGTNTNEKVEGSGLGMAIAHDIVISHGGKISAISNIGKGLKIIIKFS